MNSATVMYTGRMTNWPMVVAGVAGGAALAVFGHPWDGAWPGMAVLLAFLLVILVVGLVTSTSLRTPRGGWHFFIRSGPTTRLNLSSDWKVTIGVTDAEAALAALDPATSDTSGAHNGPRGILA